MVLRSGIVLAHVGAGFQPAPTRATFKCCLEERRRTPCPGLALLFGYTLHIFDVRTGLRQDVMQVVSDALEHETFVEKLTNARGSEQEDAENEVVLLASI